MRAPGRLLLAAYVLGLLAAQTPDLRVNLSASLPRGLYRLSTAPPAGGSLVLLCLPPNLARFTLSRGYTSPGPCATGHAPLLKVLVGRAGDVVAVGPAGVVVNGRLLPGSTPAAVDRGLRPMPRIRGARRLLPGELWAFAPHPRSVDSRYLGPLPESSLVATVEPVLVEPSPGARWTPLDRR